MKILITGGAGFIGSATAKQLVARGDEVVLLDNFNDYYDVQLKRDRVSVFLKDVAHVLYEGDIRDAELVSRIFAEHHIDKVVHLAAMAGVRYSLENPLLYTDVNINGSVTLLEEARKHDIKNFVFASSSSVYGVNTKVPFAEDDDVSRPISPYAASKRADELLAHTYAHIYKLPITALRFFTVYGPWGRPDMALFKFVRKILADEAINVYNNGDMSRNFTYIDDIVSGILTVLDHVTPFDIVNIGGDREETLATFIETIEEKVGKIAKKNMLPMQPGDVPKTVADISKLRKLGWEPRVQIDEGIGNFVEWYRAYYGE